MKKIAPILALFGVVVLLYILSQNFNSGQEAQAPFIDQSMEKEQMEQQIQITPISHATGVINWADTLIYMDPVGGAEAFNEQPNPDIVLVTDIHGDHLDVETLTDILTEETILITPPAVSDELPIQLQKRTLVLKNGQITTQLGFDIEAIPMYNLPESEDAYHPKGRGNGYLLEKNGKRMYIAGDTADTQEMRAMENIDIAFVPMNLPYTMTVEAAADAVIEFAPKQVYPYHYRGMEGFSDVSKFKELVNEAGKEIEVILAEWYPEEA